MELIDLMEEVTYSRVSLYVGSGYPFGSFPNSPQVETKSVPGTPSADQGRLRQLGFQILPADARYTHNHGALHSRSPGGQCIRGILNGTSTAPSEDRRIRLHDVAQLRVSA